MTRPLRIAAADDDAATRLFYQSALPRLGHQVHAVATGQDLVALCRVARPDLMIVDVQMPPGLDGIAAAAEVCRGGPVPVVLVSGYHEQGLLDRAAREHILVYLLKPITEAELGPAISLALHHFEHFQSLLQETDELRQQWEDRKLVEQGKAALMHRLSVDELEAYRRLRKFASDRNLKLIEVARMVLRAEEVLSPLEHLGVPDRPTPVWRRGCSLQPQSVR